MAALPGYDPYEETSSSRSTGHRSDSYAESSEEETVTVRRLPDEDNGVREVRISCPDATGLGCDISRMLLDFGLRILSGDVSTDGRWCFLIFKVQLASGVLPHWKLLHSRLEKLCAPKSTWAHLIRRNSSIKDYYEKPYLLQVTSYDRIGVLHDLMNTLWECDVVVFKAHITTSPSKEVLDMFWLYDNRDQLADNHRALEICDKVRACLGQRLAECSIIPAPPDSCSQDSSSNFIKRSACKDVTLPSTANLRCIVGHKKSSTNDHGGSVGGQGGRGGDAAAGQVLSGDEGLLWQLDEYGEDEDIQIQVDNFSTAAYTLVTVGCRDRKGLSYDLMRTLFDMNIRIAYGKIAVRDNGRCEADLFVQEADGSRITDPDMQQELKAQLRTAVALPIRISIKDVFDSMCTELLVTAYLDSGLRGRPRVTYDVTAALNRLQLCVFMADVFQVFGDQADVDVGVPPQELHRFLVHFTDGKPLAAEEQKRLLYETVRAHLMGTKPPSRPLRRSGQTPGSA